MFPILWTRCISGGERGVFKALTFLVISVTMRKLADRSSLILRNGSGMRLGWEKLIFCRQVQETVHHIINSWLELAPVIRNRQNGRLDKNKLQELELE